MRHPWKLFGLVALSSLLQTVIFPVAGPLPPVRALLAWVALVPWFWLLLALPVATRGDKLRAVLWSYLCGVLWYAGHCYWIFGTMHQYGGLSTPMAALAQVLFCLYLGLYHALFGLVVVLLRRHWSTVAPYGPVLIAVAWVAVELARARVTSFPWDLLGYAQIDSAALTALAPYVGVYGLSFVLALANALLAAGLVRRDARGRRFLLTGAAIAAVFAMLGFFVHTPYDAARSSAVLVQPDLGVSAEQRPSSGDGVPLEQRMFRLSRERLQALQSDGSSHPKPFAPGLVLWPEAPTTYELNDPAFQQQLASFSTANRTTMIVDANMVERDARVPRRYRLYNSAAIITPGGGVGHRYDKIHLVPFGEFTPYADLLAFASGLTQEVGTFDRGADRTPLSDGTHRYGTFICYESIFPDEVLQLVRGGADVLVNLSDDGWYGDTSAPFQHINMARMRAIENRRWLLRDTNTGITAAIDPHGHVRDMAPRHQQIAATVHFGYSNVLTFYTRHGDLFAYGCALLALAMLLPARSAAVN